MKHMIKSGGVGLAVLGGWVMALTLMPVAEAQHAHLNGGAMDSTVGKALYFPNGFNFVTNSGYFLPLKKETNGPYAGHHQGSLTLTALPATGDNGGPAFGHAAFGSHLEAVIVSVDGPSGGSFGFWDSDGEEDATQLTFSVPVGQRLGTRSFVLSQNQGEAGADPFGHIHGRRFSATVPGLYVVGFQLVDTSSNGPGGGPLHPPSEVLPMYVQAGLTLAAVGVEDGGLVVVYAAEKGVTYRLERAVQWPPVAASDWVPVGEARVGTGKLERVTGIPTGAESGWFRLRVE